MKTSTANLNVLLSAVIKAIALVWMAFIVFAFVASHEFNPTSWHGFSTALSLGLIAVFFLRERIDDERVHSLKLKAVSVAFVVGYPLSMWVEMQMGKAKPPLSAADFINLAMLIALGLFHYWR